MRFEKPLRELSLGEILGQTFNLYFSKFFMFFLPFLIAGLFTGAWGKIVSLTFPVPTEPPLSAPPDVWFSYFSSLLGVLFVTLSLTLLIGWIINTIVGGMAVKVASDILERRSIDLSETLSFTVNRLPSLLGAGIITGILIVVGLICLVVPGIILGIMFSVVVPAIVIERVGALESLSRSRRLVGGRWLKTFGFLLAVVIIIIVPTLIFGAVGSVFGPTDWIISSVLGALVSPIYPIAVTSYYYSMVAREQPPSPLPTPPTQATPPARARVVDIEKLHEKLRDAYILAWGARGRQLLESKLEKYTKRGLSREEAILEVATDEGYLEEIDRRNHEKAISAHAHVGDYARTIEKLTILFSKGEISEETYRIAIKTIEKESKELRSGRESSDAKE